MRYLGLDLGNRTVGIAISDGLGIVATGIETYRFKEKDLQNAFNYVKMIIDDRNVDKVVLGLPKNMDGSLGFQAEYVMEFKRMLNAAGIEVELFDERLTTMEVTKIMIGADLSRNKRKKEVDKLAAVVILQSYLDNINRKGR
jgi:putative Holliday junction resolvase